MGLRYLTLSGGVVASLVLAPLVVAFGVLGHADVVRGLLLGLVVGLLNTLLLARKLDRVIEGQDSWQTLTATMPRNMILRFSLIVAVGAASSQVPGIHLAAMAGGLALYVVVSLVYSSWSMLSNEKGN